MENRWIWPFELEAQIGAGAMGVVYRARFVKNNRRVALKLLPQSVAANPTLAMRFQREMEVLKELKHTNIVHCFGGTCEGEQWFYAMELVEGGTVASLMSEMGRIPWRQVVDFGIQISKALGCSHDNGVIHRDLKPGNLLLTKNGQIKLSDFGLALVQAEVRLTSADKTMGSLPYMAPEQIQGKQVSARTDLYALGCVLFELLTGQPPFTASSPAELMQRHLNDAPASITSVARDCPPQLELLIAELLSKNPQDRPVDAQTVARLLTEISQSVTLRSTRFDSKLFAVFKSKAEAASLRSSGWAKAATLSVVALCVVIVLSMTISHRGDPASREALEKLLVAGLRDQNPAVREFAAHTLGGMGPAARATLPNLLEAFNDSETPVRVQAVQAVGRIASGDVSAQAQLTRVQKQDESPSVRSAAATALAKIKTPSRSWWPGVWAAVVGGLAIGAGIWGWTKLATFPKEVPADRNLKKKRLLVMN